MRASYQGILSSSLFISVIGAAFLITSCATTPPKELEKARSTYNTVSQGPTSQFAPAELHTAKEGLEDAEEAYDADGDSDITRALSYNAIRRAKIAKVQADTYLARRDTHSTEATFAAESREALMTQRRKLEEARAQGEVTDRKLAMTETKLKNERQRHWQSKQSLEDLRNKLSEFVRIENNEDRMVVVLSGEVLFDLDDSTLENKAKDRLGLVNRVLSANSAQNITVTGHTDSQGKKAYNQNLSQERADSVRNHLISLGIAADRIEAVGKGETDEVSTNDTDDGRAMNRRVEIVVNR